MIELSVWEVIEWLRCRKRLVNADWHFPSKRALDAKELCPPHQRWKWSVKATGVLNSKEAINKSSREERKAFKGDGLQSEELHFPYYSRVFVTPVHSAEFRKTCWQRLSLLCRVLCFFVCLAVQFVVFAPRFYLSWITSAGLAGYWIQMRILGEPLPGRRNTSHNRLASPSTNKSWFLRKSSTVDDLNNGFRNLIYEVYYRTKIFSIIVLTLFAQI